MTPEHDAFYRADLFKAVNNEVRRQIRAARESHRPVDAVIFGRAQLLQVRLHYEITSGKLGRMTEFRGLAVCYSPQDSMTHVFKLGDMEERSIEDLKGRGYRVLKPIPDTRFEKWSDV